MQQGGVDCWRGSFVSSGRNPDGLTVPPIDGRNVTGPELFLHLTHLDRCDDCNEV